MSSKCYAVICARGDSSRVPQKNVALIAGKPMLAYTIEAARESKIFDHVIVNSENSEILGVAKHHGAELYRRPERLASATTFMIAVVQEMVQTLELADDDVVSVLFPTCPLRNASDIRGAYDAFMAAGGKTPLAAVAEYDYPIQVALQLNERGRLAPAFGDAYKRSTRHNDHPVSYRANYAVMFNTAGNLRRQTNLIGDEPVAYVMPLERSLDIDTPFQMKLARLLIEQGDR